MHSPAYIYYMYIIVPLTGGPDMLLPVPCKSWITMVTSTMVGWLTHNCSKRGDNDTKDCVDIIGHGGKCIGLRTCCVHSTRGPIFTPRTARAEGEDTRPCTCTSILGTSILGTSTAQSVGSWRLGRSQQGQGHGLARLCPP